LGKESAEETCRRRHPAVHRIVRISQSHRSAKGTYRILAGHGRIEALKSRGVLDVPVIIANVDDKQADAYTLADNKLNDSSIFDFAEMGELLKGMEKDLANAAGFSDLEIAEFGRIANDVAQTTTVASKAKSTAMYMGTEKKSAITNDHTLILTFESEQQLRDVRNAIRKAQGGNLKSIGQIVHDFATSATEKQWDVTAKEKLADLASRFYLVVKPSPVAGIGVFAARPIPKGTRPFYPGDFAGPTWTTLSVEEYAKLKPHVKWFVDFYGIDSTGPDNHRQVSFPRYDSLMDLRIYVNHSDKPNLKATHFEFEALCDIAQGEELTHNYSDTEGRTWRLRDRG
jgi:ParB-like chromosome segregation protein Spo0J